MNTKTREIAETIATNWNPANNDMVDRFMDEVAIPGFISTYGAYWEACGLTTAQVAEKVGECVAATVRVMAESANPAANKAAAIFITRAHQADAY